MGFERLTPGQENNLRQQSIEAVRDGNALPVHEGLYDPEIVNAFKARLENMSEEEINNLADELASSSEELIRELTSGDGSLSSEATMGSVDINKLLTKIGSLGTFITAGIGGMNFSEGNNTMGLLNCVVSLGIAYITYSAGKQGIVSKEKIDSIRLNTDSLLKIINNEPEQSNNVSYRTSRNQRNTTDSPDIDFDGGDAGDGD